MRSRTSSGVICIQVRSSAADDHTCMERGLYIAASGHAGRDGPPGPARQRPRQRLDARLQGRPRLAALVRRPDAEQQRRRLDRRAARPGRRHRQAADRPAPAGAARTPASRSTSRSPATATSACRPSRACATRATARSRPTPRAPSSTRWATRSSAWAASRSQVTNGTIDTTKVALFNVRNPVKQGDSNFTGQAGGQATGTVKSGSLEGSGVDPARAMVDLMASMRSLEASQRAITTIDTSLQQTASQVGGLPG